MGVPTKKHAAMKWSVLGIAALVLCILFKGYELSEFDPYSNVLVAGRMMQIAEGQTTSGFLGVYTQEWGDPQNYVLFQTDADITQLTYQPYLDQSGLQGSFLGIINLTLKVVGISGNIREAILSMLLSFLFWLLLLVIAWKLATEIHPLAGFIFISAYMGSPYAVRAANSYYWAVFTWLLPIAVVLLTAKRTYTSDFKNNKLFYCAIALAIIIKCACGFEYTTTVMVMSELPLVFAFFNVETTRERWKVLSTAFKIGISELIGFFIALAVWVLQLCNYYDVSNGGDVAEKLRIIVGTRIGLVHIEGDGISEAQESFTRIQTVARYFSNEFACIEIAGIKVGTFTVILVTIFCVVLAVLILHYKHRPKEVQKVIAIAATTAIAYLAPASWLFLASGHAWVHHSLTPLLNMFMAVPLSCVTIFYTLYMIWNIYMRR